MNLRDFEYLIALDEERHFGRAAERCFVSQPTLSAQIKKLEQYLGVQLIERQPKNMAWTAAGLRAVHHARLVHEQIAQLKTMAEAFSDPLSGSLKLGLIPTVGPYLLSRIIEPLRVALPNVRLELYEAQTRELIELLRNTTLDLLVLALPIADNLDGLAQLRLYEEAFYLAVHRNRAVAGLTAVDHGDLDTSQIALLTEGHCLREHALEICQLSQGQSINEFKATSLETLRYMVAADEVMTLMPALAVPQRFMKQSPIVYVPFAAPQPSRQVGLVYRRSTTRDVLFAAVQKTIVDVAATLGLGR